MIMSTTAVAVAVLLLASVPPASAAALFTTTSNKDSNPRNFAAIFKDRLGVGVIDVYDAFGEVITTSIGKGSFLRAHAVTDPLKRHILVIAYVESDEAMLTTLNYTLGVPVSTQFSKSVLYDNLQFSPRQSVYYGTVETSHQVNALCQFTNGFASPVPYKVLTGIQFSSFVAASAFDREESRYFAIVNKYPGHPWSTFEQSLLVANLGDSSTPSFATPEIATPAGFTMLNLAYSTLERRLYGLASVNNGTATAIVEINTVTGTYDTVVSLPNTIPQQMVLPSQHLAIFFFVTDGPTNKRQLLHLDLSTRSLRTVNVYPDDFVVTSMSGLDYTF